MTDDAERSETARPSGKRSSRRSRTAESSGSGVALARPEGRTAVKERPKAVDDKKVADKKDEKKAAEKKARGNPYKRLRKFLREVVAELRKVIWPNRKQMITYTTVVLVFVIVIVAFIGGLDLGFIKGVGWLFG